MCLFSAQISTLAFVQGVWITGRVAKKKKKITASGRICLLLSSTSRAFRGEFIQRWGRGLWTLKGENFGGSRASDPQFVPAQTFYSSTNLLLLAGRGEILISQQWKAAPPPFAGAWGGKSVLKSLSFTKLLVFMTIGGAQTRQGIWGTQVTPGSAAGLGWSPRLCQGRKTKSRNLPKVPFPFSRSLFMPAAGGSCISHKSGPLARISRAWSSVLTSNASCQQKLRPKTLWNKLKQGKSSANTLQDDPTVISVVISYPN